MLEALALQRYKIMTQTKNLSKEQIRKIKEKIKKDINYDFLKIDAFNNKKKKWQRQKT